MNDVLVKVKSNYTYAEVTSIVRPSFREEGNQCAHIPPRKHLELEKTQGDDR